jgi:hypothetical protein
VIGEEKTMAPELSAIHVEEDRVYLFADLLGGLTKTERTMLVERTPMGWWQHDEDTPKFWYVGMPR